MVESGNFKSFEMFFNKEYDKIFSNLKRIEDKNVNEYKKLIENIVDNYQVSPNVDTYQIFEFLLYKISNFGFSCNDKKELFACVYSKLKLLFLNEKLFNQHLNFFEKLFTNNKDYFFEEKQMLLDEFFKHITLKWQADITVFKFEKLLDEIDAPELINFFIKLVKQFYGEKLLVKKLEKHLKHPEVCDYLLDFYKDNPEKIRELFVKIVKK